MVNPRHAVKEKPLFNTRLGITVILIVAVIIAALIYWFLLRPLDATTASQAAGHVAQHVKPNTGRIIAKTPQVKTKTLTVLQVHAHHLRHVAHLAHLHALHVKHLAHLAYLRYENFEYTVKL